MSPFHVTRNGQAGTQLNSWHKAAASEIGCCNREMFLHLHSTDSDALVGREQAASRLLATVAGSVGSVVAVAILVFMYWRWKMAPVSRRLIGSNRGQEANQKDLPYELRKKYEAVKVLGSGSYGVVIAAWQLSDRKRTIRRAIKLVHARHKKFEEKDLRRLNREVILHHMHIALLICE